jgi:general secretion pathway protein E
MNTEANMMASLSSPEEPPVLVLRKPPYAFAKRHGVLVTGLHEGKALVSYKPDVTTTQGLSELRRFLGLPMLLSKLPTEQFDGLLAQVYESGSGEAMQQIGEFDNDEMDLLRVAEQMPVPEDLLESNDEAPIIRLINAILTEAIKRNSSDIHIETYESSMVVRFRIDGVLQQVLAPPRVMAPLIVSRIKVMAKLDIAEKRLPQDGRISLRIAGRAVDVRVSTLPGGHGERVVLRILDKQAGRFDFDQLGMPTSARRVVSDIILKPHGIFLVTGPTGSGKSTTLYAGLTMLNSKTRSILTVEDPIEYYIEGIGQSQVNAKVDMTFSRGLRAILRQDPDVVMVGEIRDLETAQIAVQASLTGHMVMSTLHTNSAAGAVTRLRDMGLESFLLASSLLGVLAQRLVRRLCPHCKKPYEASKNDLEALNITDQPSATLYAPGGCEKCSHSGYRGRSGIYEIISIDDELRRMIHDNASEQQIERYARTKTPSIMDEGRRRVVEGITSLEELLRVTREL